MPLNRDKNGAINMGHHFERLMRDESPIKAMTEEEVAFHRARLCLDCSDESACGEYPRTPYRL